MRSNLAAMGAAFGMMACAPKNTPSIDPMAIMAQLNEAPQVVQTADEAIQTFQHALRLPGVEFDVQKIMMKGEDLPDFDETRLHGWMPNNRATIATAALNASDRYPCELLIMDAKRLVTGSLALDGYTDWIVQTDNSEHSFSCSPIIDSNEVACKFSSERGTLTVKNPDSTRLYRGLENACTQAKRHFTGFYDSI